MKSKKTKKKQKPTLQQLGGRAVLKKFGRAHFVALGKRSAKARKALCGAADGDG